MSKRSKSFTLVELLVVIGIIAVLISILLPALSRVRWSAMNTTCAARMRDITSAVVMYANENKGFSPPHVGGEEPVPWNMGARTSATGFNSSWSISYAGGATGTFGWLRDDNGSGLGRLHRTGYLKTTKVFQCPAAPYVINTDFEKRSESYYIFNPHVAFKADNTNVVPWWKKIDKYGRYSALYGYQLADGSTINELKVYRRAILTDALVTNSAFPPTHMHGTRRAIDLAFSDGSANTFVIPKYNGTYGVTNWDRFLVLSNAVQDALHGGGQAVNWQKITDISDPAFTSSIYSAIPKGAP